MFLLCMLLFFLGSWLLLTLYAAREARSNATTHLALAKQVYTARNTLLTQELKGMASDTTVVVAVTQHDQQTTLNSLRTISTMLATRYSFSFSHFDVVLPGNQLLAQLAYPAVAPTSTTLPAPTHTLVQQGLQGRTVEEFQHVIGVMGQVGDSWELQLVVPIRHTSDAPVGVLLFSQPVDDTLAGTLAQQAQANVLLCLANQVQGVAGTSVQALTKKQLPAASCQSMGQQITTGTAHYLALSSSVNIDTMLASSPILTLVDIEPPATLNLLNRQLMLLFFGLTLFLFAFGTFLFALLARVFFVRPLRHIQTQARRIVAEETGIILPPQDELLTLTNSFHLLSQSLESESKAMTEQLGNVLIVSDALISTLNLEHLLGEVVARLGHVMNVKHISLLLYGREMLSPWAVAQWTQPLPALVQSPETPIPASAPATTPVPDSALAGVRGAVTVHADPSSDVTLAATTKMVALPASVSAKRRAVNASQTSTEQAQHTGQTGQNPRTAHVPQSTYGLRRPRIPRAALRDLDMILARMVIQRRKIAYAEDVEAVYESRKEGWTRLALDAGYRSVMAVPLISQEHAIGAIMLYSDTPMQVSSRDTFLLSTAAIQASMAIQNALLFAEIKEKNGALERANNLKSHFLATVTHELRSPLHSIISYGSMIVDGFEESELSPQVEDDVRFIVSRAEDLKNLVDDMLDLSKIEADRIEVKPEPLDLATSMNSIVSQFKLMANEKKLFLKLDMEELLPLVFADSYRLKQIVTNLVSNALKFTQEGGIMIRCARTRDGEMVRIAVQDTGIGISPAALGLIFEAFQQADGSTTRQFGGTGLGLTIAKRLIELQGGEIAVESAVNQGSTFSLTLPLASLDAAPMSSQ